MIVSSTVGFGDERGTRINLMYSWANAVASKNTMPEFLAPKAPKWQYRWFGRICFTQDQIMSSNEQFLSRNTQHRGISRGTTAYNMVRGITTGDTMIGQMGFAEYSYIDNRQPRGKLYHL